ncbi:helix-turn-helix transcriptional regulator [Pedobacter antarcticus]|uniref:helix-turn-helix domain-containing protein n=1 Tax=Pedobacter antarcticus TaxID=34086 RepID=UPI0029314C1E|nr:helix-turn-helix transcriptional regulator [Pedobacter antarcticus]
MSNSQPKLLGEIIKNALKEKGLNQTAVAKKMNVSKQVINQIDRRKNFDLEFLQNLKAVTGLDFTGHVYRANATKTEELDTESLKNQQVEMSLAIKLKADPEQINRMGELLISIRKEAARLGFTIL